MIGNRIRGSKFSFNIHIKEGAGAFVCGEETALLASIMGQRGMPRLRPPYPAQQGLWGKPTLINNVETYALVPWIIRKGGAAFAEMGTEKSKGTKVFPPVKSCMATFVLVGALPLLQALPVASTMWQSMQVVTSPGVL